VRRKSFRNIDLGAKTGTINDESDTVKYDWLTAFAVPKDGANAVCIAVMGIHGKRLGIRAADLGRLILDRYFSS
jgi:hypothetical protein